MLIHHFQNLRLPRYLRFGKLCIFPQQFMKNRRNLLNLGHGSYMATTVKMIFFTFRVVFFFYIDTLMTHEIQILGSSLENRNQYFAEFTKKNFK